MKWLKNHYLECWSWQNSMNVVKSDVVIVGTGASGLFAALHLPEDMHVLMLTKSDAENSDSYLAQGGFVCYEIKMTSIHLWKIL